LRSDTVIRDFDCDNPDLNDFLRNDAVKYLRQLFAVTYLVMDGGAVTAFFSVANDKLTSDPSPKNIRGLWNRTCWFIAACFNELKSDRRAWNHLCRSIPNEKRRQSYPAVKLGRLGVSKELQSAGVGTAILDWLKISFVTNNKTGCRFVVVDANNNPRTLKFYLNNEFKFMSDEDKNEDTRQMYFDLKPFCDFQQTLEAQQGTPLSSPFAQG
jgi:GNAT superfamily N-acetyltransferase